MRNADRVTGVLIVDCAGIGDCILNLPLYAALRRHFPAARITLLGQAWAAALLEHTDLVDAHLSVRAPWGRGGGRYLSRDLLTTLRVALAQRGRAELGVEFGGDLRNKLLLRLSGAATRVGLSYAGIRSGPMADLLPLRHLSGDRLLTHAVPVEDNWAPIQLQRAGCLRVLGCDQPLPQVSLVVTAAERFAAAAALGRSSRAVLVHPGAGVPAKLWLAASYADLIRGLQRRGFSPFLIAGPDEERLSAEILIHSGDLPVLRPTLREMLALVSAAAYVICLDSAAAHMSANLGTPAVILYGPQSRRVWRPAGGATIQLRRADCPSHPCAGRTCPRGTPSPCMAGLKADQVLAAFDRLAASAAAGLPREVSA